MDPAWVFNRQHIGVTSGAQRVQELDGKPEDMVFALPKELRLQLIN